MADESARRYLFVAIDRATRWVYVRSYANQRQASSTGFLRRLHAAAPMRIEKLLIDNGSQFTDRFTTQDKKPSDGHVFDRQCAKLDIEHLPQRALKHQTPLQALRSWRTQRPELFVRKPKNQTELDT